VLRTYGMAESCDRPMLHGKKLAFHTDIERKRPMIAALGKFKVYHKTVGIIVLRKTVRFHENLEQHYSKTQDKITE